MKFYIWMRQQLPFGGFHEGYLDDGCEVTCCREEAVEFDAQQIAQLLPLLCSPVEVRIESTQSCSKCGRWMDDDECGDEFPNERVCDGCAGLAAPSLSQKE